MLRITANSILQEFQRRSIPVTVIDEKRSVLKYKKNDKSYFLRGTISKYTSATGVLVADSKIMSNIIAQELDLQVPAMAIYDGMQAAREFMKQYGIVVVKPVGEAHGRGVTTNIASDQKLTKALQHAAQAQRLPDSILLQQQVSGADIRLLVVGYKVVAACQRIPASVVGDGIHTVKELIERENTLNPKRGLNYTKELNFINAEGADLFLGSEISTIPEKGSVVIVSGTANIGTGGISVDITDELPSKVIDGAIRMAKYVGLPVCGIDFITNSVTNPDVYNFIEINSSPSFGLHLHPTVGLSRDVTSSLVDYLMEEVS